MTKKSDTFYISLSSIRQKKTPAKLSEGQQIVSADLIVINRETHKNSQFG